MAYGKIKADSIIYDNSGSDVEKTIASLAAAAPTANPTFTGTVTIPTQAANDNTTKAASTAYVQTELGDYALKASPTFTGTVNAAALTLSGNLVVNGSTTTVSSTTIEVADKNIELGKVSSPSDTTADGGGITLKGATDKTITWVDASDSWEFNQHIKVPDNKVIQLGTDNDFFLRHDNTNAKIQNGTGELQINQAANSSLKLYTNNTTRLTIAAGGDATFTGAVSDSIGNVRSIVYTSKSSAHTLVASDAGKLVYISTGGVTLPNNVMSGGDAITIINNSGSDQTITQASGLTLYNTADAATGNRTLAGRGMATVWYHGGSTAYISGAGLS